MAKQLHVNYVDWHVHPFRTDRWLELWRPALDQALAFGAKSCYLDRKVDDTLHFRQVSVWENREDFERYWFSDAISAIREEALNYFNKPLLPSWHVLQVEATAGTEPAEEPSPEPQEDPTPA